MVGLDPPIAGHTPAEDVAWRIRYVVNLDLGVYTTVLKNLIRARQIRRSFLASLKDQRISLKTGLCIG